MKFAVVINVGQGSESLAHAIETQNLLLEHLGDRLASIRLAVPRLVPLACTGAIEDRPDVLVVAGGPRAARLAGQIAHRNGIPILFLPGARSPVWAARLFGRLSQQEMIEALAREELIAARLNAGQAGAHLFFGEVQAGGLPQLTHLNGAFHDSESFANGWNVLRRGAGVFRSIGGKGVELCCSGGASRRVDAVHITVLEQDRTVAAIEGTKRHSFSCTAWTHRNPLHYTGAVLRAATGADWRGQVQSDHFECDEITLLPRAARWLLLDEEPVRFDGPVTLRFLPNALRVCRFRQLKAGANDNQSVIRRRDLPKPATRITGTPDGLGRSFHGFPA